MPVKTSNSFLDPHGPWLTRGGLAQVVSVRGGSKMDYLLNWLNLIFPPAIKERVASENPFPDRFIFISDEGFLYPPALLHRLKTPYPHFFLTQLYLVKVTSAEEVWKTGLEAIQTGLFTWAFLRPSKGCSAIHLRKLQLHAERKQVRVLVLSKNKLPHWMFKLSAEAQS